MEQNKIVITDWGGVIENHSEEQYVFHHVLKRVIEQFSTQPIPANYQNLLKDALAEKGTELESIGKTKNIRPYLDRMFELFSIETSPSIYQDFLDTYTQLTSDVPYDRELVRYLGSIKDRCKLGILSNLSVLDAGRQNRQLGWDKFDYKWLSYEMGCLKPDPRVYEIVEKDCGMKGKQILFIEDVEKNLHVPREQFGWCTFTASYNNTKSTIDAIERFLKES